MTRILRAARASVCAVGLTLLTGAPLAAHHSFEAEYDANKVVTLTGIVTKLDWVNPHAYVSIDAKDDAGMVRNYKIEMGPPYALVRGGWKRDTIKVGDKIQITGSPNRKGIKRVLIRSVVLPNGKTLGSQIEASERTAAE